MFGSQSMQTKYLNPRLSSQWLRLLLALRQCRTLEITLKNDARYLVASALLSMDCGARSSLDALTPSIGVGTSTGDTPATGGTSSMGGEQSYCLGRQSATASDVTLAQFALGQSSFVPAVQSVLVHTRYQYCVESLEWQVAMSV